MAHPALGALVDTGKKRVRLPDLQTGKPVFPFFRPGDRAAQGVDHELHAVADAQHRHAQVKNRRRRPGAVFFVYAGRAARQDDTFGVKGLQTFDVDVRGLDLAVHFLFPHAPGNELVVLGAEIDDDDHVFLGSGGGLRARQAMDAGPCKSFD